MTLRYSLLEKHGYFYAENNTVMDKNDIEAYFSLNDNLGHFNSLTEIPADADLNDDMWWY